MFILIFYIPGVKKIDSPFGPLCYGGTTAVITLAVARRSFRRTRAIKAPRAAVFVENGGWDYVDDWHLKSTMYQHVPTASFVA